MHSYYFSIIEILDHETLDVMIDLGFNISIRRKIKLDKIYGLQLTRNQKKAVLKALQDKLHNSKNIMILKTKKAENARNVDLLGIILIEDDTFSQNGRRVLNNDLYELANIEIKRRD